jgi:uncharacterized damage-inducible protein DinB
MTAFHDARFDLTAGTPDRDLLEAFLEFQRDALERKCADLSDDQLCSRPLDTSAGMSLAGLVRHLATVERWYFRAIVGQNFPGPLYDHDSDEAFTAAHISSRAEAFGAWEAEVMAAREVCASHELDDMFPHPDGGDYTLRWVYLHMIDEYARHLGHADLLREAIDGRTGE